MIDNEDSEAMNRNVTASFSLSVSLVVLFAVLLYQPDGPIPPSLQDSAVVQADARPSSPNPEGKRPEPTPGVPLPLSAAGDVTSGQRSPSPTVPEKAAVEVDAVGAHAPPAPGVRVEASKPSPDVVPAQAHSTFTHARPGESLADIAVRVYGSPESAEKVWMANRDLIDAPDAIPPAGALLRTP